MYCNDIHIEIIKLILTYKINIFHMNVAFEDEVHEIWISLLSYAPYNIEKFIIYIDFRQCNLLLIFTIYIYLKQGRKRPLDTPKRMIVENLIWLTFKLINFTHCIRRQKLDCRWRSLSLVHGDYTIYIYEGLNKRNSTLEL